MLNEQDDVDYTKKDAPPLNPEVQMPPSMPACPYCRTKPARVVCAPFELIPGVTALTIYCANPACSKILAINIVNVQAPQRQSSLILPN